MYSERRVNYVDILHTTVTNLNGLGLPNVTIKLQEKSDFNQFITPMAFVNQHCADYVFVQYVNDERDLSKAYHNELHCSMVANLAMFIMAKEYNNLNIKPRLSIFDSSLLAMLAGIFHDTGHSLGEHPDKVNIKTSKQIYKDIVGDKLQTIQTLDVGNEIVLDAIGRTIYPRQHSPQIPIKTLVDTISDSLVDADSLYTLLHKNPLPIIESLYKERGLVVDNKQLVADQVDYYTNLTLYTSTGEYLLEKYLPPHLKNITLK